MDCSNCVSRVKSEGKRERGGAISRILVSFLFFFFFLFFSGERLAGREVRFRGLVAMSGRFWMLYIQFLFFSSLVHFEIFLR